MARNPKPKFRFVRAYRDESGSAWRMYEDGQGRTCSVLLSSLGGRSFVRTRARRCAGRHFRGVLIPLRVAPRLRRR
jgi:hypothetical protein